MLREIAPSQGRNSSRGESCSCKMLTHDLVSTSNKLPFLNVK